MAKGFYFAWVTQTDTAFTTPMKRVDEEVFSFTINHAEGDFAELEIEIRNPRVGLLTPLRTTWAWLAAFEDATVTPLFFGRLVGMPRSLQDDIVALSFVARPANFKAAKAALAETLKVAPYWDPLFIDPASREDPETVLEGRAEVWAVDRTSHALSVSSIVFGEDGTLDVSGDAFFDSVQAGYSGTPDRSITVKASVDWSQYANGSVDVSKSLPGPFYSYTGDGVVSDWPKPGTSIGSGWSVLSSSAKAPVAMAARDMLYIDSVGFGAPVPFIDLYRFSVKGHMVLQYDVSRARTENLTFTLRSDVQALVTETGDEETRVISFSGKADEAVDAGSTMPIGDVRARAYFPTDRGKQSLEYLIAVASANLLWSARCVDVSFDVPFSYAGALSLRKNARLADPRLPGGEAIGKIKAYSIFANGDTGEIGCRITIGCTPGRGGTATVSEGTPTWADGYMEDFQAYAGATYAVGDLDVTYDDFSSTLPDDDGVDFYDMTAANNVVSATVSMTATAQFEKLIPIMTGIYSASDVQQVLTDNPTRMRLEMRKLNTGPFQTDYAISVSDLLVPKLIDLEAA